MRFKIPLSLLLIGSVLIATSLWAREDSHVLVLGRISDNPAAHYDRLRPLLDYVVAQMGDVGIREGRVLMARDTSAMLSYLRQGRVDWVTETVGAGLTLIERGDAEPVAVSWRGGARQYCTVFLSRSDSGVTSLDDLVGRKIAFQHPNSTSAYLVPAAVLLDRGLSLAALLTPMDASPPEQVGYAFTGSEANSVAWLHQRLVDVAAISNLDYEDLVLPIDHYTRDLRVIDRSPDYPRALELVRGGLPAPIRQRLVQVLTEAANNPDAAHTLENFFRTERFTPFNDEIGRQLDQLAPMVGRVRSDLQ